MSRKRKARLDLSSPALDAIHRDNTVSAPEAPAEAQPSNSAPTQHKTVDAPLERSPSLQGTSAPPAPSGRPKTIPKPRVRRLQAPSHPLSFRLGITDPAVVASAEALAAPHGADPMLVLKRFVREAMAELKAHLQSGDLARFPKITKRPEAQIVLTSTARVDRAALEKLKAHMDPLDLFAGSAVLGFALDQILTETHSGKGRV